MGAGERGHHQQRRGGAEQSVAERRRVMKDWIQTTVEFPPTGPTRLSGSSAEPQAVELAFMYHHGEDPLQLPR